MEFEYDPAKSASNKTKHGIDFEAAKALFDDQLAVTFQVWEKPEVRWVLVAMIGFKHWTAVYTLREDRIRIISVRRSREKEERFYDHQASNDR